MVHTQSRLFYTRSMGRRTTVYRAAQTCILGLILLSFASASSYLPRESPTGIISNDGFSFLNETSQLTPRDEKPFTLRIMPLGASITYGYQSTNGNGYRRWLHQQLRHAGWWVNMVGSNPNDTSTMNDNASHYWYLVAQLLDQGY